MTTEQTQPRRLRITIRVSEREMASLVQAAERAGLCLSAHVRLMLAGAKPSRAARRPPVEVTVVAEILARLGGIASALNQIAQAIRSVAPTRVLTPTVERELLHALSGLRRTRHDLLRALGRKAAA